MKEYYNWLTKIGKLNFEKKSVLIIGGSELVLSYLDALKKLGIRDITIIADTGKRLKNYCNNNHIELLLGGYEKHLSNVKKMDLVIIATPIQLTLDAANMSMKNGQNCILLHSNQSNLVLNKHISSYHPSGIETSE